MTFKKFKAYVARRIIFFGNGIQFEANKHNLSVEDVGRWVIAEAQRQYNHRSIMKIKRDYILDRAKASIEAERLALSPTAHLHLNQEKWLEREAIRTATLAAEIAADYESEATAS